VKDILFYLWHRVVLHSANKVEVEAAATCSEKPLSYPDIAGPRLLWNVATKIKKDETRLPEDPSQIAKCRKASYVSFMINIVDAVRNKICYCTWEACTGPWEQLGFLNNYDFFCMILAEICVYFSTY